MAYHHGDLPATLIKAVESAVAESGVSGISLRDIAIDDPSISRRHALLRFKHSKSVCHKFYPIPVGLKAPP